MPADRQGPAAEAVLFPRELADALSRPEDAPLRAVIDSADRLAGQLLEGAASSTLQASVANIGKAVSALGTPQADRLHERLATFKPAGSGPEAYEPLLSQLVHWSTRQYLQTAGVADPEDRTPDCPICTLLARQVMDAFRDRRQEAEGHPQAGRPNDRLTEHALDAIQAGCWEWDLQNQGSRVDARYARLLGYAPDELGRARQESFTSLLHPEDRTTFEQRLQAHLEHPDHPCTCVVRLRCRDGGWLPMRLKGRVIEWDGEGNPLRMAGLIQTMTPDMPDLEHGLFALHDPLTGLPNRLLLTEQLQHELAVAARENQSVVVLRLAVPDFSALRSAHGHDATDHLLVGLAARMRETLRETTLMARVDDAGFVLIMRGVSREHETAAIRRLQAALRLPLALDDRRRITLPLSIGLSRHDPAHQPRIMAEALLEQAEQALQIATRAGDGGLHVHDPETDRVERDRRRELERIRAGLSAAEFVLHYQPTVDLRSGAVIALEGLARWQHPELGLLAPARFIPLIEDDPLAIDFGRWEIETALAQ
ncbi:MAG: diguanylate cyclase domain-containing protein, partial [Halothiobacillaceae bacterium]